MCRNESLTTVLPLIGHSFAHARVGLNLRLENGAAQSISTQHDGRAPPTPARGGDGVLAILAGEPELTRANHVAAPVVIAPAPGSLFGHTIYSLLLPNHHYLYPPSLELFPNMIMPQHRSSVSSLASIDSFLSTSSSSISFAGSEPESVAPVEGLCHVKGRLETR